ncbi:TlpA disulfide reductase family protein [Halalkalibacter krulwichiae]|uniref:Sporulation thiol-disulfide oxidoreductase A n=1 Tax=Halalkalibacter krulwichiae TaxID=199441 RepID=A0A1X9MAE3_9BACI|nr:TlpA disulfide reductase family protein [Halalkalibacter krulwichiae]ARK30367.1 Sporulation thiol-disulfide oxidoreductase A precursor [Halalkalibacter krulwichiae]
MIKAPNFTLASVDAKTNWSLDDASKKVTMLTFWTSWCPDSQKDLVAKQALFESMATSNELEMIMIHVTGRDPGIHLTEFLKKQRFTFPVYQDEGTKVYDLYRCMGVPTTVLINKDKEIAFVYHDKATIMDIMKGVSNLIIS